MTEPINNQSFDPKPYAAESDQIVIVDEIPSSPPPIVDTIDPPQEISWEETARDWVLWGKAKIIFFLKETWDFLLYEVLFFIFNRDYEKKLELQAEMEEFVRYCDEVNKTLPESHPVIRKKFYELSRELQERIKEEMADSLQRSTSPEKTPDQIIQTDLLHDPFVKDIETGEERNEVVFFAACIRIRCRPLKEKKRFL